jgi:predicted ribosomally synthesized peptide with nif11-like leader
MAIQDALTFLREVRHDEDLASAIEELDGDGTLDDLARVAERAGFSFTADELQRAHALDWKMRWARFSGG